MKTKAFFAAYTLVFSSFAFAQVGTDGACPGLPKAFGDAAECAAIAQYRARDAEAATVRQLQQREEQRAAEERWARDDARKLAQQEEWNAMRARQDEADQQRRAELVRHQAAEERSEARAAKQAAVTESFHRERCGADYKSIRIGMTVQRVSECVSASFRQSGQTNTDQGIVTTYRAPGGFFHAIDGKVVQWGKF